MTLNLILKFFIFMRIRQKHLFYWTVHLSNLYTTVRCVIRRNLSGTAVEVGLTIHLALEGLQPVDLSFDLPVAPYSAGVPIL